MAGRQILNEDDCHTALERYLKTKDFRLTSYKILNFHNPFQGLVGEHFTLSIEYEYKNKTQSQNFFVKTLSTNPLLLKFSKDLQINEREEFWYQLLEDAIKYNIDTSYAPKGVFFKPSVVVLEQISNDYKGTPKRHLLDLEHSRSCLETLAKFHATSIIYEKKKEKEVGKKFSLNDGNPKVLQDPFASKEETLATKWMACAIEGLFHLIDVVLETYITNEDFKNKLLELISSEDSADGLISGVLHGDLWSSNFLHLYDKAGKPSETKLLDFQLLKYGPLELDIVEFLMTNTTRALRSENFDSLVEHYYKKLKELLTAAGLNSDEVLPSSQDFVISCNNFKLAGKIHAVVDHSYTFMADEIYGDVMKSEETLKNFIFEGRSKYVIESYNGNEMFRKMLCEDIVELRDLLFS